MFVTSRGSPASRNGARTPDTVASSQPNLGRTEPSVYRTSCARCCTSETLVTLEVNCHSCWRASVLAFCRGGRPVICIIYIPCISCTYSMYIYTYIHIWRAARNVKNLPANNYVTSRPVLMSSKLKNLFFGYFDPEKVYLDNENKRFSG